MHLITRSMLTDDAGNFRPDWYHLAFAKPSAAQPTLDWTAAEYAAIVEAEVARRGDDSPWTRAIIEQDVWTALFDPYAPVQLQDIAA